MGHRQTLQMFIGESICLVPLGLKYLLDRNDRRKHYSALASQDPEQEPVNSPQDATQDETTTAKELKGRAVLLFFAPAFCDIIGTSLMNVGLIFIPVSIYQ